jgi:hypothetical protein
LCEQAFSRNLASGKLHQFKEFYIHFKELHNRTILEEEVMFSQLYRQAYRGPPCLRGFISFSKKCVEWQLIWICISSLLHFFFLSRANGPFLFTSRPASAMIWKTEGALPGTASQHTVNFHTHCLSWLLCTVKSGW